MEKAVWWDKVMFILYNDTSLVRTELKPLEKDYDSRRCIMEGHSVAEIRNIP